MALAVNRAGVIIGKCDMSNHRPGRSTGVLLAHASIRARPVPLEKCPHASTRRDRDHARQAELGPSGVPNVTRGASMDARAPG